MPAACVAATAAAAAAAVAAAAVAAACVAAEAVSKATNGCCRRLAIAGKYEAGSCQSMREIPS